MNILDCIRWRVGLVRFKPPAPKGEPFPNMPSVFGKVKFSLFEDVGFDFLEGSIVKL
jgi:hypothetical protein